MIDYFERQQGRFEAARAACKTRGYFSPFADTPLKHPLGEAGRVSGDAAFHAALGKAFEYDGALGDWLDSEEVSPYTRERLGLRYRAGDIDPQFAQARSAMSQWAHATPARRVGVLLEAIDRLYLNLFELSTAGMHTTGQSYAMSYAGSGTNALDRGLEALVYAFEAMTQVPTEALWERTFGAATIRLRKRYRLMPRGVAVCFTCASFPMWNMLPSVLASLATGNAVIVKPHPATVYPVARTVAMLREVLAEAGFSPNLISMVLDTSARPIGKTLVKHPQTAIVDFTGSVRFGAWVEANAYPALAYTETAGVNTVVLESTRDLAATARSLATTLSLFSAQMCTSPQNIYIPRNGIVADGKQVSFDDVVGAIATQLRELSADSRRAPAVLAAIQSDATLGLIDEITELGRARGKVVMESKSYEHPEFAQARTATPLMVQVAPNEAALHRAERFGPISFVVPCESAAHALDRASADAKQIGALTAFLYSTDGAFVQQAEDAYADAGAQLTCNLTGPMPLNFAAAYSDYHVTGLNPAGNASLTETSFVASRFRIVQSRSPV